MKNIFLIGMPSSGKSTLGKELTKHIRYRYLDTDKIIAKETGKKIKDIFAEQGELFFRDLEHKTLHSIRANSKLVISTGGGMPCFNDNMTYIKQNGLSVFLNVPVEIIYDRIQRHSADDRPLLDKQKSDVLQTLKDKQAERLQFYNQADVTINGEVNVHELLEILKPFIGN
jgi:shikimate kinase